MEERLKQPVDEKTDNKLKNGAKTSVYLQIAPFQLRHPASGLSLEKVGKLLFKKKIFNSSK